MLTYGSANDAASKLEDRIIAHLTLVGAATQTVLVKELGRSGRDTKTALAGLVAAGKVETPEKSGQPFRLRPPTSSPRTNYRDAWRTDP